MAYIVHVFHEGSGYVAQLELDAQRVSRQWVSEGDIGTLAQFITMTWPRIVLVRSNQDIATILQQAGYSGPIEIEIER